MATDKCRCDGQTLGGENRRVFCEGPLLDAVQRSKMFPCCKYFVDMSCIFTPAQILDDFNLFSNCRRNDGSLKFLQMFVEKHFNDPGSELEPWTPPDWKDQPSFLTRICDPEIKKFGSDVNELWKQLGRRIKDEVKANPDLYSIIYVSNPFIVPSSDCREYCYWESFWIIRGLLQCGMHQTARGMIDNFLSLVQQYGFVPQCGRIYCTSRSNPPLLIMMVKAYMEVTNDEKYAINALPLLETEYQTFISKHSVKVKGKTMYQYRDSSAGPRPEAYSEDLQCVANIQNPQLREVMYTELKSASESGMANSSRWYVTAEGTNQGSLRDTKTSAIVPVELNAIVFRSGKILAEFNRKAGNTEKADEYQDKACALVKAIRDILWNAQAGIWLDYDLVNKKSRNYFCCTNFAPLWARAFPLVDTEKVSNGVMQYIMTNNLDEQYGGVPFTMNMESGQKWDYPNVFPPMMFLVIEGLENLGTPVAKEMSRRWAHRWVKSNYAAYKYENFMFENYFCEEFGSSGGASPEHTPVGYGWTNGVIIEFLCKYGKDINLADDVDEGCKSTAEGAKGAGKHEYIITSEANMDDQPPKKVQRTQSQQTQKGAGGICSCGAGAQQPKPQQQAAACELCGSQRTLLQQTQSQQTQKGAGGTCSCGAGAQQPKPQQQAAACEHCRSQRTQSQQTQKGAGGTCSCGAGAQQPKPQQQAAACDLCGSQKGQQSQAQMRRSQIQQGQTGADCACGAVAKMQQQQRSQQQFQGARGAPSDSQKQQQQQMQIQKDCMQQQQEQRREFQRQEEKRQCEEKKEDCTTKPQPQDCSKHLKSQQEIENACSCMDDDEVQDGAKPGQTGNYFPVGDKEISNTPASRTRTSDGSDGANDCSCLEGQGQGNVAPPPTFICPHCGGLTSQPPSVCASTHTVGTNKASAQQDDCDCSGAGAGGASGPQQQQSSANAGAGATECGPCKSRLTSDYPTGHGPKPYFNKQFPLADPVHTEGNCPPPSEKNKKKKCCNCDEKEEEE
ncbi:trehalase isoform X2 [Drosophila eugracilis]|uniref:trehalase isoform X2 n=1 Tax=Drosophila eugracilis TaxID=29029 RepID=UPI0007E70B4F|nr:trehalase isoform X2 [Drosophila eugracilis]